MGYVEGFVVAVPAANKETYLRHAAACLPLFKEFGATRVVEAWGDDVPDGKLTDFRRAVKAREDEVVVFAWIEYPDRATRDEAGRKMASDPRAQALSEDFPFDGTRMIYAGFQQIVDLNGGGRAGYIDGTILPAPAGAGQAYREWATTVAQVFLDHGASRVVDAWGDDVPDGKVTDYKGAVQAGADETVVFGWIEWPSKAAREAGWRNVMSDSRLAPDAAALAHDGMKRMVTGGFAPILDA